MMNDGRNRKRPYEGERTGLTEELTFLAIPRNSLTNEPIISEGMIEGHQVRRIRVDSRSSSEIMYEHCFKNFNANIRSRLRKCRALLIGFSSETYHPLGVIDLRITIGEIGRNKTVLMEFAIVKCHSPYNVLIGRTEMRSLGVVGSIIHSMIKFLTDQGVVTMETSKEALWECKKLEKMQNSWKETQWRQYMEQMSRLREHAILRVRNNLGRRHGKELMPPEKERGEGHMGEKVTICSEGTTVPRFVMEHQLKAYPLAKLVVHKKRPLTPDRRQALKKKVFNWLKEGIIRKV
ncbi:hypothetical protein Tco_1262403 [Tanacetum coccineum]